MAGYALPAEVEERQVLESCRAGDHSGLDLLYRRYAPALVAFCEHRLGALADAEDAAHETILKAHRAMPRFREGARLWPWLATIAANVCTDMQRSRERLTSERDEIDCLAPDVDEDVSRRLRAAIADQALDELPERFRTPLFLREYMGWSYDDIAQFSNKSIGSVRTTLMRARRAFQSRVEDVARRRGQWPLPAAVVGGRRRLRDVVRSWRDAAGRAGADTATFFWRAEGVLAGLAPSAQMAVVAVVAAGTLAATPAVAADGPPFRALMAPASSIALAPADNLATPSPGTAARPNALSSPAPARTAVALRPGSGTQADEPFEGSEVIVSEDDSSREGNINLTVDPTGNGEVVVGVGVYNSCKTHTLGDTPCAVYGDSIPTNAP